MWDKIANKINDHVYMSSIDRDKQRIQSTAEIFTPTDLVIEMLSKIDINRLGIGKTVLDPACGDGQFLVAVKYIKVYIQKFKYFFIVEYSFDIKPWYYFKSFDYEVISINQEKNNSKI